MNRKKEIGALLPEVIRVPSIALSMISVSPTVVAHTHDQTCDNQPCMIDVMTLWCDIACIQGVLFDNLPQAEVDVQKEVA